MTTVGLLLIPLLSGCEPPSAYNAEGKADGAKVYELYCTGCHGADGTQGGNGRDLRGTGRWPEEELISIVEKGRGRMPGMGKELKDDQIRAVVTYVKKRFASPALKDNRPT